MAEKSSLEVRAPKDPEKKRSSFYILRNKQTAGSPQEDGSGVQYIYLNDDRLVSFARIAGGITDEGMLALLKTAEGFRRLVYAVGVSVETKDPREQVRFVLQMYGKTDPYVTGTVCSAPVGGDGMETLIKLSEVDWSSDDDVPGQIRFVFPRANTLAQVSVRLYLTDGFEAPEPVEEGAVDFDGPGYRRILSQSLYSLGNVSRLKKALARARSGEETTVAFIGGSITQGAGAIPINDQCYAWKTFEGFCRLCGRGTDENIRYVKAGVGGTSSELGMLRYDREVCCGGKVRPDVVVVEFAVNDAGDETEGESYECLVRKILLSPQEPAVILLFSVFADDYNLQERLSKVGEAYHLPMVSIKNGVTGQFYFSPGEGRVISKNQYFYDVYHPSGLGHRVMADCLMHLISQADQAQAQPEESRADLVEPVYGKEFTQVRFFDRDSVPASVRISPGDFDRTDTELQEVERDLDLDRTPEFPHNWKHEEGGQPFSMDIVCSALLVVEKDSASVRAGKAEAFVDGEKVRLIDPREVGWVHCNALILARGMERKEHHVEIRMAPGEEEKQFTILGFGFVDDGPQGSDGTGQD